MKLLGVTGMSGVGAFGAAAGQLTAGAQIAVSPAAILNAVYETATGIQVLPELYRMKEGHRRLFGELAQLACSTPETRPAVERLATMTVGLLDTLFVDEMACVGCEMSFQNFYGREFGYSKKLVVLRHELDLAIERLQQQGWFGVESLSAIEACPATRLLLMSWRPFVEEAEMLEQLRRLTPRRTLRLEVCVPYHCGDVAALARYEMMPYVGNEKRFCWEESSAQDLLPPHSPIPRQEYWHAMLCAGISLFSEGAVSRVSDAESVREPSQLLRRLLRTSSKETMESWRIGALRRLQVLVRHSDDEQRLSAFSQEHVRHYTALMHQPGLPANVLLTRSGVSANEVAIQLVSRLLGKDTSTMIHPGWYYENRVNILSAFPVRAQTVAEAQVLFVSTGSTLPERFLRSDRVEGSGESYLAARDSIDAFLKKAERHPNLAHVLVVDKTMDLLLPISCEDGTLPPNVALIETASLTKHQRGARNYFFGLLAIRNAPQLLSWAREEVSQQFASLTPFGIIHVPRLTVSEVHARQKRAALLNAAFVKGFAEAQLEVPEELRWETEQQSYFTYLFPSVDKVLSEARALMAGEGEESLYVARASGNQKMAFQMRAEIPLWSRFPEELQELGSCGIRYADSFGLNETRLNTLRYTFRHLLPNTESGTVGTFEMHAPRLSPGLMENEDDLFRKGLKLGSSIGVRMLLLAPVLRRRAALSVMLSRG